MRIAIIGGGVSGLTAGFRLHEQFDLTLFEANGVGQRAHAIGFSPEDGYDLPKTST